MVHSDHDARLGFWIRYPSSHLGLAFDTEVQLFQVKEVRITENVTQEHVNVLSRAHLGFITRIGDFEGEMVVYETSGILPFISELRTKNLYFDLLMAPLEEGDETFKGDLKVLETLLEGAKMTTTSRSYQYGTERARNVGFKWCTTKESLMDDEGEVYDIPIGSGILTVNVTTGATSEDPNRSSDLTTK